MMHKKFLSSLNGLLVSEAEEKISFTGLKSLVYPKGQVVVTEVKPNTVLLWVDGNKVVDATAGDPLEVV